MGDFFIVGEVLCILFSSSKGVECGRNGLIRCYAKCDKISPARNLSTLPNAPYVAGREGALRPSSPSRPPFVGIRDCPGSLLDCRTYPFVVGRIPFVSTLGLKTELFISLPHSLTPIHTPNTTLTGTGLTFSHGLRRPSTHQCLLRSNRDSRRTIERWALVDPVRDWTETLREEESLVSLAYGRLILLHPSGPQPSGKLHCLRVNSIAFGQTPIHYPLSTNTILLHPSGPQSIHRLRVKSTVFGQTSIHYPSSTNTTLRITIITYRHQLAYGQKTAFRRQPAYTLTPTQPGNAPSPNKGEKSCAILLHLTKGAGSCGICVQLLYTHNPRNPLAGILSYEMSALPLYAYTLHDSYEGTRSCAICELYTHSPHDMHNQYEGLGTCEIYVKLLYTHNPRNQCMGIWSYKKFASQLGTLTHHKSHKGAGSCAISEHPLSDDTLSEITHKNDNQKAPAADRYTLHIHPLTNASYISLPKDAYIYACLIDVLTYPPNLPSPLPPPFSPSLLRKQAVN